MSAESGPVALAITGASGAPYAFRLLEVLLQQGTDTCLMLSSPGRLVVNMEMGLRLPSRARDMAAALRERFGDLPGQLTVFGKQDWFAPVASGSNPPRAMVVCPCTTGTLASIAAGNSRSLIDRAAEVVLKEQRKLILVPRETPLSVIHLENMLRLARAGAVILPANPGFYHMPGSVAEIVDFVVARILDHLDVTHTLVPRWGTNPAPD